ncbi:MAG TPA: flagellar basal-body MS-ring/collar protein FliF, partial [Armatimonadota bacterium]|nr:flagellar basal-body MS-ring/collar protein FliF [Armatimonadota bacterium]
MPDERPSSLGQRWAQLNTQHKAVVIATAVIIAVAVAVAVSVAGAPRYVQLYGNLTAEDAAQVVRKLKEQKIKHRLSNGGTTIEVPDTQVDTLRLSLAGDGIPQGGNVGFELFDKPHIGQSEFSEHLNYLRALQGELARTISQLESVRTARVHLVIPQHRLFVTDVEEASASVVLALRGGRPDSRAIKAMIHLVSSAVEGLDPARVTVVDTRGNLLSDRPELTGSAGLAVTEMQRAMETQMEERLQSMLDQVLGANNALVRANVLLNRNSRTIQRETYSPVTDGAGRGVLESQHRTVEQFDGARAPVGGAAGI